MTPHHRSMVLCDCCPRQNHRSWPLDLIRALVVSLPPPLGVGLRHMQDNAKAGCIRVLPSGLGGGCWDRSGPLFLWEGRLPEGEILSPHLEGVFLWHVRTKPMSKEAGMVKTKEGGDVSWVSENNDAWSKLTLDRHKTGDCLAHHRTILLGRQQCSINICWVGKCTRSQETFLRFRELFITLETGGALTAECTHPGKRQYCPGAPSALQLQLYSSIRKMYGSDGWATHLFPKR